MEFIIETITDRKDLYSNKVLLNPEHKNFGSKILINDRLVFNAGYSNKISKNGAGLSRMQREFLEVSISLDTLKIKKFDEFSYPIELAYVKFSLTPIKKNEEKEIKEKDLSDAIKKLYLNQYFSINLQLFMEIKSFEILLKVKETNLIENPIKNNKFDFGKFSEQTIIEFEENLTSNLKISSNVKKALNIFKPNFNFSDLGVGGLDQQIAYIFRKAFSSRRLPNDVLKLYGINHIKGLILYGPPGTGKTLIARQLGKCLKAKEPKIVKGPELFNKYVGETEANLRKLFEPAIADYKKLGDNSQLHIIIFDEFDAIAKARGSTSSGTGVNDNLVNQLLSIVDGVEQINNILVIGMTNRIDLLDKAILRPGRFDCHVEVGLPNEEGRLQILNIHTKTMRSNNLLDENVDLKYFSKIMKNYTGAEIENVVKSANSIALNKKLNLMDFNVQIEIKEYAKIEKEDFLDALKEVKPEYGVQEDKLEYKGLNFKYNWKKNEEIVDKLNSIGKDILNDKIKGSNIIIYGDTGTGKTTLACYYGLKSNFPFVKLISSEELVGQNENYKINQLVKYFEDAKKSPFSLLIVDDLERLIEYVPIGCRFNNNLLQTLLILIKQSFKTNVFIIATTSNPSLMKKLGFYKIFNLKLELPNLKYKNNNTEIEKLSQEIIGDNSLKYDFNRPIELSIKNLLFICELMIKSEGDWTDRFLNILNDVKGDEDIDYD